MVNLDYLYNPETAKPSFDKNYFVDKKLSFQVIENGIVLPSKWVSPGKFASGIVNSEGKNIQGTFVHRGVGIDYTPPQNQFNIDPKLQFISARFMTFGGI